MLTKMRAGASSWPAKIFLCLIALSFVGWGVGDIFVSRGETTVAAVGDADIDIRDLEIAYNNYTRRLQNAGFQIEPGSEIARTYARGTLDGLILQTAQAELADKLGISVGEDTLRNEIARDQVFTNASGAFDSAVFAHFLTTNGITEERYLAFLDEQITNVQLVDSISSAPLAPDILVNTLYRYRQETRTVEIAVLENETLSTLPQPDVGELDAWFEERRENYRRPEYRSVDFLLVYPEDIADAIEIDDAVIRQDYESNLDRWTEPEERLVRNIVFDTQEEASAALDALEAGADFGEISSGADVISASEPEWITRETLFEEIAAPVFNTESGKIAGPIESTFGGWLIYRIDEIKPHKDTTFDEARETITAALQLREAQGEMYRLANSIDDLIASGATVEETAYELGLDRGILLEISSSGQSSDINALQVIPSVPEFLGEVFRSELDFPSPVIEVGDGGVLVVEVTDIVPSRLHELDEVRDRVRDDWQQVRISEDALAAAEGIAAGASALDNLDEVFGVEAGTFMTSEPFTRSGDTGVNNVGRDVTSEIFEKRSSEFVIAASNDSNAVVVARVFTITPGNPLDGDDAHDSLSDQLADGIRADIRQVGSDVARNAVSVSINQDLIEQYF